MVRTASSVNTMAIGITTKNPNSSTGSPSAPGPNVWRGSKLHCPWEVASTSQTRNGAPAQHTVSLDGPVGGGDEPLTLGDRLGLSDDNLERVEMQDVLEQVMAHLTPRERKILALRFVEQLPQTEVAKRLGISQMHVSRLQRAAVEHLRMEFGAEAPV